MINLTKDKILIAPLIIISAILFWGAIVYKIYALNFFGVIIISFLAVVTLFLHLIFFPDKEKNLTIYPEKKDLFFKKTISKSLIAVNIFYLINVCFCFYVLFANKTSSAIISPWQVLPEYYIPAYLTATLLLLFIILLNSKTAFPFIIIHYFLSFTVAFFVYKIGYGFDPFIHQATIELIEKNGEVTPKPFYYLGQYSLVILFHKITTISIFWINKILTPLLGALLLPLSIFIFLQKWFNNFKINLLLILSILIFPFSFLIITTPQNLSYIFLSITILLGLSYSSYQGLAVTYLLSLATLSLHPITGIPALLFSLLLTIYRSSLKINIKKYLYFLFFALTSFSLPFAFLLLNFFKADEKIIWQWQNFFPSFKNLIPRDENFILNFIYMYDRFWGILIAIIIILGILIAIKHWKKCKILLTTSIISLGLFISYTLTTQLSFSFLIEYERNGYADRILVVAILFLFPFIFISLYAFLQKLLHQKNTIKIPILLFLAILISTSLYLSYPRFDNYHNSHGYSVSAQTLKAVDWIENNSSQNYIVLANQQVSVSALSKFGFNKYYKNDVYFYPIPTSGKLYDYYLDMVHDKPSREIMEQATKFAGVKTGYFVLNKYWWAFPKILKEAKIEADKVKKIKEGEIYIFKYQF